MNLNKIVVSLLFVSIYGFASEKQDGSGSVKKCPCGPIEHVFTKQIVARYAEENPWSGLVPNYDTEGLPGNVVEAVIAFGRDIRRPADKDGNPIVPRVFPATGQMVLPVYLDPNYKLKTLVLSQTEKKHSRLSSSALVAGWNSRFEILKSFVQDGVLCCGQCKPSEAGRR